MTDAQRERFYFPNWRRCAMMMDWHTVKGAVLGKRLASYGGPEVNALYQRVWDEAYRLAQREHRAVTDRDLRHACHVVALGSNKDTKDLTTDETSIVVALFNLFEHPDDLDRMQDWLFPDRIRKRTLLSFLKRDHKDGALRKIAENAFKTRFYEDLELQQLRWIAKQLRYRTPAPARDAENEPF